MDNILIHNETFLAFIFDYINFNARCICRNRSIASGRTESEKWSCSVVRKIVS